MTQTELCGLPQFEADDPVQRTDFNGAFSAIDAALGARAKIASGSYVGTGALGASHPNTLTFPFAPKAVLVMGDWYYAIFLSGNELGFAGSGSHVFARENAAWSGNSLSWYARSVRNLLLEGADLSADEQLNKSGVTYRYVAIG